MKRLFCLKAKNGLIMERLFCPKGKKWPRSLRSLGLGSLKTENGKYKNTNGFDARHGLKKIRCYWCCWCCCVCVCMLCGGCQSTTPGRVVVRCVREAYILCGVRVARSPAPEPKLQFTTATSPKQTKHRGTASAAVDKAYGAAIDIEAAPCQSSRIWPHAFVGLLGDLASTRP